MTHSGHTHKRCTHCGETKLVTAFSKCRGGYQSACRPCRNAIAKSLDIPVNVEEARCRTCREVKPATAFNRSRRHSNGLQSECKPCTNARKRATEYPVSVTEKYCYGCDKTLPASDFPRDKKRADGLRNQCRACCGIANRASIYKLSIDEARRLALTKACHICAVPLTPGRGVNIDHCHATGRVRGALCGECNRMLGCAKDCVEILQSAINYLLLTNTAKSIEVSAHG